MRRNQWLQVAATGIAGLGLVLPSGVMAAQPATPITASANAAPSIVDVRLNTRGMLVGQVVDAQGVAMPQATVTLRSSSLEVASTVTNAQGSFSLAGLHGGVYEASSAGGSTVLRVWTAEASPPSANKSVMIVSGGPVARGQFFNGPNRLGSIALFGVIVGGVTTAALITDNRTGELDAPSGKHRDLSHMQRQNLLWQAFRPCSNPQFIGAQKTKHAGETGLRPQPRRVDIPCAQPIFLAKPARRYHRPSRCQANAGEMGSAQTRHIAASDPSRK